MLIIALIKLDDDDDDRQWFLAPKKKIRFLMPKYNLSTWLGINLFGLLSAWKRNA